MTGVPASSASITTRPKASAPRMGKSSARASAKSRAFSQPPDHAVKPESWVAGKPEGAFLPDLAAGQEFPAPPAGQIHLEIVADRQLHGFGDVLAGPVDAGEEQQAVQFGGAEIVLLG